MLACMVYIVTVTDCPLPDGLPLPCTFEHLFTHYLDVQCIPRRYFFELLMNFTQSDLERERLTEFCSPEGQVNQRCIAVVVKVVIRMSCTAIVIEYDAPHWKC